MASVGSGEVGQPLQATGFAVTFLIGQALPPLFGDLLAHLLPVDVAGVVVLGLGLAGVDEGAGGLQLCEPVLEDVAVAGHRAHGCGFELVACEGGGDDVSDELVVLFVAVRRVPPKLGLCAR